MGTTITRDQVLAFRVHAQQLDREPGTAQDADVLDLGVQDTGPDGARWALELRGCRPDEARLFTAWTLRGAPHVYRRAQAATVARATSPWSENDAGKRIFDAAKPLRAAEIPVLDALATIASQMRDIVQQPTVKSEMSTELTRRLPAPYRRYCGPCDTIHLYEQPFRLAALQAGLALRPGTSPPVLERLPRWRGPAKRPDPALDPVRGVLRFLGPVTPKQVAAYVDTPVAEVKQRWPEDVSEVFVEDERRHVLQDDLAALEEPPPTDGLVRLLGPFDLFLQARDRELVLPDPAARKDLWRTLGRPGAVLVGHEVVGGWRPRSSPKSLKLQLTSWSRRHSTPEVKDLTRLPGLVDQAERLAEFRGLAFAGFTDA